MGSADTRPAEMGAADARAAEMPAATADVCAAAEMTAASTTSASAAMPSASTALCVSSAGRAVARTITAQNLILDMAAFPASHQSEWFTRRCSRAYNPCPPLKFPRLGVERQRVFLRILPINVGRRVSN